MLMFSHPGARARNIRGKVITVGGGLTFLGLGCAATRSQLNEVSEFIRYSLPALEVRTMLAEMRRRGEAFTLEYTRIRGPIPWGIDEAERWRIDGCGTRVSLREDGRGGRECLSVDTCDDSPLPDSPNAAVNRLVSRSRRCAHDEIAMIDARPGLLASTLLASNPYPIMRWNDGSHIYGRLCGTSG